MNYLCLCYYDVEKFAAMTPEDMGEMIEICRPHDATLRASGHLKFVGSLGMPHESHTLRSTGGTVFSEDKPFDDTKFPIGAFFMIEADDMEQAKSVAALHPGAHLSHIFDGGIEIRPVGQIDML